MTRGIHGRCGDVVCVVSDEEAFQDNDAPAGRRDGQSNAWSGVTRTKGGVRSKR